MATLREISKSEFIKEDETKTAETTEINAGSLQRIADAVEKIASGRDWFKEWHEGQLREMRLIKQIRAYKGIIKKMKEGK